MSKEEKIIFPVILVLFIINFHFFQWYDNSYRSAVSYMKTKTSLNTYESVMTEHPYYEIYNIARLYKEKNTPIVYIQDKKDNQEIDYTTTYYINRNKPVEQHEKRYLSELGLFMMYYFYPHYIDPVNVQYFSTLRLTNDTIIISDTDLQMKPFRGGNFDRIEKIVPSIKKEGLRVNRQPTKEYYLYRVKSL